MSFVGKAVGSIGKALGLVQTPAVPTALPPPPVTPTMANSQNAMDAAAKAQAAALGLGRTSTMLTGGTGVDDSKNTSKVLLGQ